MAQKPSNAKVSTEQEKQYTLGSSPVKEIRSIRHCTDIYCIIVYSVLCVCMWCLAGYSFDVGFPGRLQRGIDMYGKVCGYGEMAEREYLYYPDPKRSLNIRLCLSGCPVISAMESICSYTESLEDDTDFECFNAYPSKPFFNKVCLPAAQSIRQVIFDEVYSADRVMTRVAGDLTRAWGLLAIGAIIVGGAVTLYFASIQVPILISGLIYASIGMAVFLMAALCFLIYEESWRVEGKICDDFKPVLIQECDEGDIANGYKSLCWVTVSLICLICIVLWHSYTQRRSGMSILIELAKYSNEITIFLSGFATLALGAGVYAFFITFLVYQISCGRETTDTMDISVYYRDTKSWEFDEAERVLVFFTVPMALWHFSVLAQGFEFIVASYCAQTFFRSELPPGLRLKLALKHLFRYHLGSILLAAAIVPVGRVCRGILLGMKWMFRWMKAEKLFKICLNFSCYKKFLSRMTSDPLSYMAIMGDSFFDSAKRSSFLFERHGREQIPNSISSGNCLIWVFQLTIMLIGPVFVMYWVLHEPDVFQDSASKDVTSVVAMGIYSLFFSWFGAQVYSAYARGTLHGSIVSYLVDLESNGSGERMCDFALLQFLEGSGLSAVQKPNRNPTQEMPVKLQPPVEAPVEMITPGGEKESEPLKVPPPSRGGQRSSEVDMSQSLAEADQLLPPVKRELD